MSIASQIKPLVIKALKELYDADVTESDIIVNTTKPEFEGDYTVVLFAFIKSLKKPAEQIGKDLGDHLVKKHSVLFQSYNVIKGFLNLTIVNDYWINFLQTNFLATQFGIKPPNGTKVVVEYSSPNTNKPLHLGHLRNIFLGWSVAEILKAIGYDVIKSCIINDRGIHICKSMIAWQKYGNGATPQSANMKGDHFVGLYYVMFNEQLKKESQPILQSIYDKNDFSQFDKAQQEKIALHLSKIREIEAALH